MNFNGRGVVLFLSLSPEVTGVHLCESAVFAYNKENVFGLTTNSERPTRTARSLVTELLIHVK